MRKNLFLSGLAIALTFAAAGAASAQGQANADRASTQQVGPRRGGPGEMLLKGITLSSDQKARLKALHGGERRGNGQRGANGTRQRPDSATMAARRAEMTKNREARIASMRSILTPAQAAQFDRNVAEFRAHAGQRGHRA